MINIIPALDLVYSVYEVSIIRHAIIYSYAYLLCYSLSHYSTPRPIIGQIERAVKRCRTIVIMSTFLSGKHILK